MDDGVIDELGPLFEVNEIDVLDVIIFGRWGDLIESAR